MNMNAMDSLYREVVLDHHRHPRGSKVLAQPDREVRGQNPSCGDDVLLQLELDGERIVRVGVHSHGCAISTASGSMLAEIVEGLTLSEARRLADAFKQLLQSEEAPAEIDLGDLEALVGVRRFPVRIKCALLPWVTLLDAILEDHRRPGIQVSTAGAAADPADGLDPADDEERT
jgi:nitrogen fixation NifU-like protein